MRNLFPFSFYPNVYHRLWVMKKVVNIDLFVRYVLWKKIVYPVSLGRGNRVSSCYLISIEQSLELIRERLES